MWLPSSRCSMKTNAFKVQNILVTVSEADLVRNIVQLTFVTCICLFGVLGVFFSWLLVCMAWTLDSASVYQRISMEVSLSVYEYKPVYLWNL